MMQCTTLASPFGILKIFADERNLYQISLPADEKALPAHLAPETHPLLSSAKTQLAEYFAGQRQIFELPLVLQGTSFQKAVWAAMLKIPYGETRTYAFIAAQLGHPNKARAVGQAASRNPLPIVIPCHRVIGCSGKLTGFSGGLKIKKYLLALEKSIATRVGFLTQELP